MAFSCFVSCGNDAVETVNGFRETQNLGEWGRAGVGALIGAKTDTEDQRLFQAVCKIKEILDAGHEICFLKSDGILTDQLEIPEKFFGRFQFYHGNICIRGRTGKIRDHVFTSCGDAGKEGSVTVFIDRRDDGERIFCAKGQIDVIFRVRRTIA